MTAGFAAQPPLEWAAAPHFDASGKVLLALIEAPPWEAQNRPDHRTQIDVEIHGHDPQDRVASALLTVSALTSALDQLRSEAQTLAPADWKSQYANASGCGLFLVGFEFHDGGLVRVLFDFGDPDLLILDLKPDGARTVSIEP